MGHVLISAAHKSSGKTMVTTGLVRALVERGRTVAPFKKGPDYIDPKWLGEAAGRPCYNLDFHTQSTDDIKALFASHAQSVDIAIIEGNKGLHDGVDVTGTNSNAALAKCLSAPVVLVIDASGITRGIAPLLMGYQVFDPEVTIAGVILNKVTGPRHRQKLIDAVEHYTDIAVLGTIARNPKLNVDERHLGLIPSNEHPAARAHIDAVSAEIAAQIDLDHIEAICARAPKLTPPPIPTVRTAPQTPPAKVRIAVAKDAAFGFYYADDLDALKRAGAQLVYFNALNDIDLPTSDGLFLGGGFPETQMKKLAANKTLRRRIKAAIEGGLPTYAECGGLMYLTRSITWHGERCDMAGVIPADTIVEPRPQGRGYVSLRPRADHPWGERLNGADTADATLPAHEFHYSRLENIDTPLTFAFDVVRGTGIDGRHDGIILHNMVAGYAHLRTTNRCPWADAFTAFVRDKKQQRGRGRPRD